LTNRSTYNRGITLKDTSMGTVEITLKKSSRYEWTLYAPKGHALSAPFRGSRYEALEWATKWISSWYNWVILLEDDNGNQEKD